MEDAFWVIGGIIVMAEWAAMFYLLTMIVLF